MAGQLRLMTLNEGENREAVIFRLEKGWTLWFVLGPSLADKEVRVFVNHPEDSSSKPDRSKYHELSWQNMSSTKSDVYDNFAEVKIIMGGSFNYFFTIDGSDQPDSANGQGYFLVDPFLRVGQYDEKLPLDSITCQTVLAKSLGPFEEWPHRLRVAKECGYNMVHFTPLQELGYSNSSYSLADQHKLNHIFSSSGSTYTFDDVEKLVNEMKVKWEVLSLTDLVFNHTANNSPWIKDHPEGVYNCVNSPHLKPAYFLDRILWHFSIDVGDGKWLDHGIPPELSKEKHLQAIQRVMWDIIFPKYKIEEYYLVHVEDVVQDFRNAVLSKAFPSDKPADHLEIIPDPRYRRLKATVDIRLAVKLYNTPRPGLSEEERLEACCEVLRQKLGELNDRMYREVHSHLEAAVTNFLANARWRFIDPNGPRTGRVDVKKDKPIMWNYFLLPEEKMTVEQEEQRMHTEQGAFCMAHNGWVMGDDPMRNFAEPGSNVYLRRELLPWGDSVKLRYGKGPEDCPFLWNHMAEYTRYTARIFHGVRLDNCHSTPIHVAEYMLDEARKVRPDLYVIAELFTSSEHMDNLFINRLGLTSLIREGLNAWDAHELGRLVHRFGGLPVGSFMQPPARPLMPTVAHAIFFDQTHDNPSPIEKRSVRDPLASAGLVAMTCCATGSNRGYDELVPHHIHVVTEPRVYRSWTEDDQTTAATINKKTCFVAAKKAMNQLHADLGMKGYGQVYVDDRDKNTVAVTRHNPTSHQSVIMVARTAFNKSEDLKTGFVPPLTVSGVIEEVILEARTEKTDAAPYEKDPVYINGCDEYCCVLQEHVDIKDSHMVRMASENGDEKVIEFINFPPGSVIVFRVSLPPHIKKSVLAVRSCLSQFGYRVHTISGRNLQEITTNDLDNVASKLSLNDLNRVLFRCDAEERDDGKGFASYSIPGHGPLVYCGLQGIMSVLSRIRAVNDLGHPLCGNLRDGDWLLQYCGNRLKEFPTTAPLGVWLEQAFSHLAHLPRYMVPCYFDAILTGVYMVVQEVAWARMSEFVTNGSSFVRALAMGSLQMCSIVKTALLPPLAATLDHPKPEMTTDPYTSMQVPLSVTLAAGLPHFASGIFRNWGRDTFIAIRGLMLLTGRFEEARCIILSFAGCLRHGLMPNLLGSGVGARFNCRDAIWWWLQAIQDYTKLAPEGTSILQDKVVRLYPDDEADGLKAGDVVQPLWEVIQEALQRHADGVAYRERNAGSQIDNDMTDSGFNIKFGIDWKTGFVHGGNEHNCGTWMDKMGSSDKAGNKGKPATPRDGSAVELVGLSMSTLCWLDELSKGGVYPNKGVHLEEGGSKVDMSFHDWSEKIKENFEKHYWISDIPDPKNEPQPELINKRGMYKDLHGASQPWTDYQLRPNFPIAMVMAPSMFTPSRAWIALSTAEEHLLGPLGMKTLDPSDWNYNGNYINSDDSGDPKRARGFNYHQGPEWLWPVGYFLRAKLYFANKMEADRPGILKETIKFIKSTLSQHNMHLQSSDWRSLPELTNRNGVVCPDSCPAQAWSMGCILEVLYDLEQLSQN